MDRRFPEIEAFAEIGEFIDQPVKTYSSGMVVRLAFAVAIHVDPEILLVDEALAVGDVYFRQRCMRKVHELRSRGITILFVSHATGDVKALGDRAMWLEHGHLDGHRKDGSGCYLNTLRRWMRRMPRIWRTIRRHHGSHSYSRPQEIVEDIPNIDHRFGDGKAEILGIAVFDPDGRPLSLPPARFYNCGKNQRAGQSESGPPDRRVHVPQPPRRGFRGHQHRPGRHAICRPCSIGEICTVDFYVDLPAPLRVVFSFSPAIADGTLEHYVDLRLDR